MQLELNGLGQGQIWIRSQGQITLMIISPILTKFELDCPDYLS